ncbi:MAG: hypothetical protein ACRBN8_03305 [Nannocystales bacterium]
MLRALLLAACLGPPQPTELGQIELGPADAGTALVRDESGATVATVHLRPQGSAVVHVPPGAYTVDRGGETRSVVVTPGTGTPSPSNGPPTPPSSVPEPELSQARLPPPASGGERTGQSAWRAPLMAAFVPGLGHAWTGKPGWGVGLFAATVGASVGAVALGLGRDGSDGATPSDASRSPGYARLGGLAALSSIAGALYVGQIFDAHRVERGERLSPRAGRVQLRFDRLSAVAMAPGRPRASLLDDLSLAALVRVSERVRVGPADASIKLGPEQTVLQLGARATAALWGPNVQHPYRRWSFLAGGGVLGQLTTQRRTEEHASGPVTRVERAGGAEPYLIAEARLFVAPRWSVGALGRFGVPLTPRRYAAGRTLPAWAPTLELGVSLGVNL